MAKTAKVKKRTVSLHSRAARRETSPSLNTDRSLKNIAPPTSSSVSHPAILSAQNAGISKKKKQKPLSRQQRLRQQKGMERADVVSDKLEKKVAKSVGKRRTIDARRKAWEVIDGEVMERKSGKRGEGETALDEDAIYGVNPNGDVNAEDGTMTKSPVEAAEPEAEKTHAPEAGSVPEAEEDEIL